jgi:hypothetical protein
MPHTLILALFLSACNPVASQYKLTMAAETFNDAVRWQRFDAAVNFLPSEERSNFLRTFLTDQNSFHLTHVAIQHLQILPDSSPTAAVVLVLSEGYTLPSTTTCDRMVTQRWEYHRGRWEIVSGAHDLRHLCGTGNPLRPH